MDRDEAIKHCRNGAVAAFFSAAITAAVVVVATGADGELALFNDPLIAIDVLLIVGCAIGMLRKSRAAAMTIFVYFIISKVAITLETGQASGLGVALVFVYFYGKAIQGSFTYHRLMKAEDPEYKAAAKWTYVAGIPAALVLLVWAGAGLMSSTDYMPSTRVLAGSNVSEADRATLISEDILFDHEKIEYFYSYGLASILEGGSILTDRAVIIYFPDEDSHIEIYELEFAEIESVELMEKGGFFSDSLYRVQGADPDNWIVVDLSIEADGHLRFIEALKRRIAQSTAAL